MSIRFPFPSTTAACRVGLAGLCAAFLLSAQPLVGCSDAGTPSEKDQRHHDRKDHDHHDRDHGHTDASEHDHDHDHDKDKEKERHGGHDHGDGGGQADAHGHGDASGHHGASDSTSGSSGHGHDPGADEIVFYVSMHGADGGNTIIGLTSTGEVKGSVLRGAPAGAAGDSLKDLRGMCLLGDGSLLVVNAWLKDTRIVKFGAPGSDGVRDFRSVFIQGGTMNPALMHTYSVVVGPDGAIYCSNQDTNTVTRYAGPGGQTPGAPLPPPPSLSGFGNLAPGTFIPNDKTSPEGLVSVRGIAFGPDGLLYVADRGASRVSAYDPASGARRSVVASERDGLGHPIQLAFSPDGRYLFIGDNKEDCVWRKDLDSGAITRFVAKGTGGLEAPSALVVTDSHLFVGNRKEKAILRFKMPEGHLDSKPFVEKLPDDPEFLLYLR